MSEFADHVAEILHEFGGVQIRRMFGGQGLFRDGLMFALIADDVLYLKADARTVARFEAQGLEPFAYTRGGKRAQLSYYRAPDAFFEDAVLAREWAAQAFEVALRAHSQPGSPRKRPRRKAA